ncbi:MAG: phenylacetate--CoA ligase [Nitrososphaerota archaeon]
MKYGRFIPPIKDKAELEAIQLKGLRWTVEHAYKNSDFYRKKMQEHGVTPDMIRTLDDIKRLPFTTAQDLQEGYPFPLRAVDFEKIVRIHASSGTTGKRKVLCYTQKDIDDWMEMFARCYEFAGLTTLDRVQIAVGYGVWTAGVGFQLACEKYGAMAIPVGPGNLDMQCQFLMDLESTVLCCTASMALLMAEEVNRRGIRDKIKLKKVIMGSERSSDAMRQRIKDLLGVDHVFDITGLTELYGPGAGIDCEKHMGIHYWADFYILEILDPNTLDPVFPGEVGEMVVTTLKKEAAPLIRYRTRDLTRLIPEPCECGSVFPMHDRILGRSDDMFVFRGVNIYPSSIDEILSGIPELGSEFQIILERGIDGRDYMKVRVERDPKISPELNDMLSKKVEREIENKLLVSCVVEVVDYGTLPRTDRKTKRVIDMRGV